MVGSNAGIMALNEPKAVLEQLLDYCRKNDWAGYDPYDALNSQLFAWLPFLNFRVPRLVFTQVLKRCPINLRPFLLIGKTHNPKAIALFLTATAKLSKLEVSDHGDTIVTLKDKLLSLRTPNSPYWCWGYSFPWQTRTVLVPRGASNLVCTVFAANALLDLYELQDDSESLDIATSSAEYLLKELYWTVDNSKFGFSYPSPSITNVVHNANFLGAALLCRVYDYTKMTKFLEPALKVAAYSAKQQASNGSWDYGDAATQRWADNFHTGYNLCALSSIARYAGTAAFDGYLRLGFEFYRNKFFGPNDEPKYFHDRTYPLDVHSAAQSIITLLSLQNLDEDNVKLAEGVFRWAMDHLWSEKGYFYYQVLPRYTNRVPYMRWSQAWMLLALVTLLESRARPGVIEPNP